MEGGMRRGGVWPRDGVTGWVCAGAPVVTALWLAFVGVAAERDSWDGAKLWLISGGIIGAAWWAALGVRRTRAALEWGVIVFAFGVLWPLWFGMTFWGVFRIERWLSEQLGWSGIAGGAVLGASVVVLPLAAMSTGGWRGAVSAVAAAVCGLYVAGRMASRGGVGEMVSGTVFLSLVTAGIAWDTWARSVPMRRGSRPCEGCGYDLSGGGDRCPECGRGFSGA